MHPNHRAGLTVRTHVADALLDGCSPHLTEPEVRQVLDCGFSSTLAAVRNRYPLLDYKDFPGESAL